MRYTRKKIRAFENSKKYKLYLKDLNNESDINRLRDIKHSLGVNQILTPRSRSVDVVSEVVVSVTVRILFHLKLLSVARSDHSPEDLHIT